MAEHQRQLLVFDMTADIVVGLFDFEKEARDVAVSYAESRLGHTVVLFEIKEAFRAAAQVSRVFLEFPTRADDRPKAEPVPPAVDPDFVDELPPPPSPGIIPTI